MRERRLDRLFDRYRRKGDPEALASVFDVTARELLGLAGHLSRDAAEAEDLVQQTFLTAIERAASYDGKRALVPWLVGILVVEARRRRRDASRTPDPARLETREEPGPAREAESRELSEELRRALARLPEPYASVLALHLEQGSSASEIGEQLERAPGTVRVQIHRGLELLRKTLPAGVALGAALTTTSGRGLAAVREQVFRAASEHAGKLALAPAAAAPAWLVPAGLAVVAASVAWIAFNTDDVEPALASESDAFAPQVTAALAEPPPALSQPEQSATTRERVVPGSGAGGGTQAASASMPVFLLDDDYVFERPPEDQIPPTVPLRSVVLEVTRAGTVLPDAQVRRAFPLTASSGGSSGARTDATGRMLLTYTQLWRPRLWVHAPGCRPRMLELPLAELDSNEVLRVDLEPGPMPSNVKLTGADLSWACLLLHPLDEMTPEELATIEGEAFRTQSLGVVMSRVREDGLLWEGLRPGRWLIEIRHCGSSNMPAETNFALDPMRFELEVPAWTDVEKQVTVEYGGRIRVRGEPATPAGLRIRCRLTDEAGEVVPAWFQQREPAVGGTNDAFHTGGTWETHNLPPGIYTLEVAQPGYQPASATVEVRAREIVDLTLPVVPL